MKIGNVYLNETFYPGQDLYSDGVTEDALLEVVKKYSEDELNHVIAKEQSWTLLYHLSHIRGNIIKFYPWKHTEHVLEIGSGCGAITTELSKVVDQVTCVELSKKRSEINANRNKERDNIEILLGNFEDIEPTLEQYDVVTLIGVFEYAANYIHGQKPYEEFLAKVLSHTKKGGHLIIAIENRLGLKYWAGAREDHFGVYYEGLEGYPNTEGIRTFSKKEWITLLEQADLNTYRFYYPYPDYKLPMAVYSDERLPKTGELHSNICNFDRSRMQTFDEQKVFDTLIENNLFTEFSNSFLIDIQK